MSHSLSNGETNDLQPQIMPDATISQRVHVEGGLEQQNPYAFDASDHAHLPDTLPPEKFGSFRILSSIAAGGMGVVYEAHDDELQGVVALKVMKEGFHGSAEKKERFIREIQVISRLKHPNVVEILKWGEVQGVPYFVMHLAEGGNLRAWLKQHSLERSELVALVEKIGRAVQFIHEHGVLHRDLKPSNVLMSKAGDPLLADFGLAKLDEVSQQLTSSNAVLGSPHYMAPEQIRGSKHVDATTDVWALGVMLYELLLGRLPFMEQQRLTLFEAILHADPPLPRSLQPHFPAELERILLRCLEKQCQDRYPSALALVEDLARWQRGETGTRTWKERWRYWGKKLRRHAKATAAGSLFILLLCVSIFFWSQTDPYRSIRSEIKAVESGSAVTLIDSVNPPKYWRELIGIIETHGEHNIPSPFDVKTMGYAVVELFPGPLPNRYRLETEVRHESGDPKGQLGLVFRYRTHRTSTALERTMLRLSFAEYMQQPNASDLLGEGILELCFDCFSKSNKTRMDERTSLLIGRSKLQSIKQPMQMQWRHMQIDVDETQISAYVDGQLMVTQTWAKMARQLNLFPLLNPMSRNHNPQLTVDLCLQPSGGVGLYLYKAVGEFRNCKLIPLP